MKTMKVITLILLVLIAAGSLNAQTKSSKAKAKSAAAQDSAPVYTPPPPAKDGAFIQITSGPEHPTSVLMGLTMALQLADDYDVIVFLDVRGPEVALIKTPSLEQKRFEASKILFQKLIDKGIRIIVCRTCLEVLNKTEFDLVKGVKIANKSDLFDFTKGRILSLTY